MKLTTQSLLTTSHAALYRLTGGRILNHMVGFDVLLLTTTGRKTGKRRTIPITYLPDGEAFVIIASNGGSPHHPGWFLNLQASGEGLVDVRGRRLKVRSGMLPDEERQVFWERANAIWNGYNGYAQKTERKIPLVRLTPV